MGHWRKAESEGSTTAVCSLSAPSLRVQYLVFVWVGLLAWLGFFLSLPDWGLLTPINMWRKHGRNV